MVVPFMFQNIINNKSQDEESSNDKEEDQLSKSDKSEKFRMPSQINLKNQEETLKYQHLTQ